MQCPTCNHPCSAADNYCRRCGTPLTTSHLPVRRLNNLPVSWQPAPIAIRSGLLALAVGTGLELLRRQLVRVLARSASRLPTIAAPQAQSPQIGKGGADASYSLTETVVLQRSWIRWARPKEQHKAKR